MTLLVTSETNSRNTASITMEMRSCTLVSQEPNLKLKSSLELFTIKDFDTW